MKKIILICIVIKALTVNGQQHFIGLRGGLSLTNTISKSDDIEPYNDYGFRKGINGGLTYDFVGRRSISFSTDFIYNQRGMVNEQFDNIIGQWNNSKINFDYLSMALKTGIYLGNKAFGYINIGSIQSFLIKAQTISTTYNNKNEPIIISSPYIMDFVKKFDIAGIAEIGGGYKFNGRHCLFGSVSYQRSLTNFQTSSNPSISYTIKHYGMIFNMGFKFSLTKPNQISKGNHQKSDKYDSLKKLKELLDSGAISQEEYEREKVKLLE